MNILEQKIWDTIAQHGRISFESFMEMALYEPDLGYYASEKIEIGKAGDYYTSQHVHPIFGAMIGKQLEEMWLFMGKPSQFYAVEPGAGTGHLCSDLLGFLKNREMYSSLTYLIAEPHTFMQAKQKTLLEDYPEKVQWVSTLDELSELRGCILSNELLDAFPVHMVEMDGELREIYVTVHEGSLTEAKGNLSTPDLSSYLKEFLIELPKGYRTEINLGIKDWIDSASRAISEGFILTIDYGYPAKEYYSEERNRGTLLCYHKHQLSENPYENIGDQDITAHVNFSSVKKWGDDVGLKTLGFCPQGTFLVSLGIDEIIAELYKNSPDYLFEVAKIKRLLFPGTLGETHKVMIQYKGKGSPQLRGFSIRNQMHNL
jgi:SAM-dependent MidA family methyltransferase